MMNASEVIQFWFVEHGPEDWFKKSDTFDEKIRERFLSTYRSALLGELHAWRQSADGRLAEILVLDQFSRNIFRGSAQAFAGDPLALCLAQWAVDVGADQQLDKSRRPFLYMPYMHSESAKVHDVALALFEPFPKNFEFEKKHKVIIDRFGRYPHRNDILGRQSTPEEVAFLQTPGSSF